MAIYFGKKKSLSSSKHWVNCRSQQDWQSIPLPSAEAKYSLFHWGSLSLLKVDYWDALRPSAPIKITLLFLFQRTSKRPATPCQALHHSQTYYKLSNHLAKDKKMSSSLLAYLHCLSSSPSCFRQIPPALFTFLSLKCKAPSVFFPNSWQVCSCAGPVMSIIILRLLQKVQYLT